MTRLIERTWLLKPDVPREGSLVHRILADRGLTTAALIDRFIHPQLTDLSEPNLLPDMAEGAERVRQAIHNGEHILIHGDYDADGITSTALLLRFLQAVGARVEAWIPDRLSEGYGLSEASVSTARQTGCQLLLTVDCGITAREEIAALRAEGIDVVVTDHHECPDILPAGVPLINPKRSSHSASQDLAGVGVALQFVRALSEDPVLAERMAAQDLTWQSFLDLAALGTVADVVPLTGDNRILVAHGVERIREGRCVPGIKALLGALRQNLSDISAQTLGFVLAPRINACGRLGDVYTALRLLMSDDFEEAAELATAMIKINSQRQKIEQIVTDEAIQDIDAGFDFMSAHMVVAVREHWHPGVIGIVAARLADHYNRPAIVLCGEDGLLRGSARSVGSVDLLAAMHSARSALVRYGGHARACGLILRTEQLDDFRKAINAYADANLSQELMQPSLEADLEIQPDEINESNAIALTGLAPFGEGNPVPLFILRGAIIEESRVVGNGRHLKMTVRLPDGRAIDGIAFGMGESELCLEADAQADLLFSLELSTWRGSRTIQMSIRDVHNSGLPTSVELAEAADRLLGGESLARVAADLALSVRDILPLPDHYRIVYRHLHSRHRHRPIVADLAVLACQISRYSRCKLHPMLLHLVMIVFAQADLVCYQEILPGRMRITLQEMAGRIQLDVSPLYHKLRSESERGNGA